MPDIKKIDSIEQSLHQGNPLEGTKKYPAFDHEVLSLKNLHIKRNMADELMSMGLSRESVETILNVTIRGQDER
jgi:hypothetical protein